MSVLSVAGLIVISFLTGCRPEGTVLDQEIESFYFEPVGSGFAASVADTTELVFRDRESWTDFRQRLAPLRDFPDVDFEQMMVIVAAVPAPTGGYFLEFEGFERIDGQLTASYVVTQPGADCVAITALTQPFQAIAARRVDGPVAFTSRTATERCANV